MRAWSSLRRDQLAPDPFRDLRNNGVSGSESLRKVGRIQSEAKPIIFRRSLPLNHLIPSVRVSDESCTAHTICDPDLFASRVLAAWSLDRDRSR